MKHFNRVLPTAMVFSTIVLSTAMPKAHAAPKNVTLVKDGNPRAAIYVAPAVMGEDKKQDGNTPSGSTSLPIRERIYETLQPSTLIHN